VSLQSVDTPVSIAAEVVVAWIKLGWRSLVYFSLSTSFPPSLSLPLIGHHRFCNTINMANKLKYYFQRKYSLYSNRIRAYYASMKPEMKVPMLTYTPT